MKKQIVSALLIVCILMSLVVPAAAGSALPFEDVPASAWYYEDLCYAYENALINGRSSTKFAPNEYMTYAEAVKLAACMHQMYTQGSVTLANGTPWYAPYVEYCRINGIISKDYSWDSNATRAGYMEIFAAALPARALREINGIPVGSIPDVDKYHPQADAIYLLYRAGIVNGVDEAHACNPSSNIKRAEVAAILTRMMDSDARVLFSLGAGQNEYTPSVPVKPDEPDVPGTPEEPEEPEIPEKPEEPGEEELAPVRQKALDYMRAMGEVVWSPAETLDFTSISSGTMYAGTTYRGLPYVNTIDSSLEEFQGSLEDGVYTGPTDIDEILGVDCSSSVLAAWSQIGASFNYVWTWQMMPFVEGGTIPVGEYTLPEEVTYGSTGTDDVIALNDQQTIYRAYAQLKPADAVINYTTSGHTRMVAEAPVIIYKSNGEISNASYIVTHEIWKNNHSDGELNTCWYLDRTYTFGELYNTSYLPVTCPELAAEEAAEVELKLTEENTVENLLTEGGLQGKLESNYRIFEVDAEIVGSNGAVVRRVVEYPINTISLQMASKTYNLEKLNDALYVEGLGADTYTLTLSAKVAGELQPVLTLKFSKENTLRDSVVAYLEAMASVEWKPSENLNFTSKNLSYAEGNTYVGLPYVNQMDSTLEEFESYLVDGVYTGPTDFKTCIGVDGSSAVLAAWAMEASSFDYVYTKPMLPSYTGGTLPVGGYDTVNYVSDMDSAATTSEMIVRNGRNGMYRAYAQLQPADLIFYYYSSTGRASMVVETPVVVYGEDGTVDGAKSYVTTLEIDAAIYENEDSTQTSWKRKTYTFEDLFEAFYVPVTCEELATGAQSKVQLVLSEENTSDSIMESGLTGTLTSNYRMVSVKATIMDAAGHVVRTAEDFPLNTANLKMQSKQYDLEDLNAELMTTELPAGNYKLRVEVLAGGQWLEVMNLSIGKLSELRQFVVDSITAMATVEWTPKVSFGKYSVGTTYSGMPWSNAYVEPSLMEFKANLDANGVYQGSTSTSPMTVLGVDLISSISAVYEMIHPDINFTDSAKMIAALRAGNGGLVKVGEYDPAKSTAENGEQTMYQAYAQLQPADVVVGNSVYAFMVTSFPKVVYLEDGTINGEESYITVTQIDNSAQNKWFVNNKQYTFKSLYSGVNNASRYCYPATCETLQTDVIPQATVNGPETVYENGGFVGTVTSNYRIYQVVAELCDSNKETVETLTVYPTNLDKDNQIARSYDLSDLNFKSLEIGKTYTLKLSAFVANELKEVGTYSFTAEEPSANTTTFVAAPAPAATEIEDLRDFVVKQIKEMANVPWTAPVAFGKFEAGETYYGLPWVNNVDASLAEFKASLVDGVYQGGTDVNSILGVDLISAITSVYGLIDPKFTFTVSADMLTALKNETGLKKVGNYNANETDNEENDAQTLFKAYAELKPGDILVGKAIWGFTVTDDTVTEYNEDGSINGDKSFVYVTRPDNSSQNKWFVDQQYSFQQLYDGIINKPERRLYPATFQALWNADQSTEGMDVLEAAELSLSTTEEDLVKNNGLTATLTSNYRIYQVVAEVRDEEGNICKTVTVYPLNVLPSAPSTMVSKSYDLSQLDLGIEGLDPGVYTVTLSAHVANELEIVGTYTFTK